MATILSKRDELNPLGGPWVSYILNPITHFSQTPATPRAGPENKEVLKLSITGPLWEESTSDQLFSFTKANNVETISISSHHHTTHQSVCLDYFCPSIGVRIDSTQDCISNRVTIVFG